MRFKLAALSTLISLSSMAQKADYNLIVGTYTSGKSEGIYVYGFDLATGDLALRSKATGIKNPSYLKLSADKRFLYAVSEMPSKKGGVASYKFDPVRGSLSFMYQQEAGDGLCFITCDKAAKSVFVASYGGGSISALSLNGDGSIGPVVQTIQSSGSGPDAKRQAAPHMHSTVLSPDERFLFASDLGTDAINVYKYDPLAKLPLTAFDTVKIAPGSGPRHLVFNKFATKAYLISELKSTVTTFDYNEGKLKEIQTVSMLPDDFEGKAGAAAIRLSGDGRFLYASNRLDLNEIVIYKVEPKSGKLTFVGRQSSLGLTPRDFNIDPTDRYLLVANQNSDNIIVFERDKNTGLLKSTGKQIEVGNPVCLKWVKASYQQP